MCPSLRKGSSTSSQPPFHTSEYGPLRLCVSSKYSVSNYCFQSQLEASPISYLHQVLKGRLPKFPCLSIVLPNPGHTILDVLAFLFRCCRSQILIGGEKYGMREQCPQKLLRVTEIVEEYTSIISLAFYYNSQ